MQNDALPVRTLREFLVVIKRRIKITVSVLYNKCQIKNSVIAPLCDPSKSVVRRDIETDLQYTK